LAVATAEQPAPQFKPDTRPVLEITRNTKLDPAKKYGAIVIKASNITLDGGGAWLTGAHPELDPKDYKGIAISASEVSGVTLKNINAKGWDVALKIQHGSNWTIEDCDFSNNYTYPAWGWWGPPYHGGIILDGVDHSTLRHNKANNVWDALELLNSNDNVIEKNDFSHTSNTCVWMVTACRNRFTKNNLSYGIRISPGETHARDSACVLIENGSDDNYFGDNDITHGGDGVFLRPLNRWVSRGNVFERNDASYAHNNCFESQAGGNIFRHNKANYGSHGIWIGLSDESVIEDNECCYNGTVKYNAPFPFPAVTMDPRGGAGGIIIIGQSNHTVCRGNKCIGNKGAGVVLWGDPGSPRRKVYHWVLDNNEIRDNRVGIYLRWLDWLDMGGNVLDNKEDNLVVAEGVSNVTEHAGDAKITASPRAVLEGPSWAVAGKPAFFNAAKSSDEAGRKIIFRWDLDDGSPVEHQSSVTHAFREAGYYRVGVTVTNGRFSDLAYRDFHVVDDLPPLGVKGVAGKAADWAFQGEMFPREGAYWTQQTYIPIGPNHGVPDAKTRVQFIDDKECTLSGPTSVEVQATPSPSGNMVSLLYPRSKNLDVPLQGKNYLVFWNRCINPSGGGLLPIITLYEADNKYCILRPASDDPRNYPMIDERIDWKYWKIPLRPAADDKQWKRDGDLPAKVNFITIDFSPWGSAPLRMWFDAFGVR
jgi:parallel beta-helix repeat protein